MRPRRTRGESGSVVLESVLVTPLLLMLLMGTIEFGRLAYTYAALEKVMYGLAQLAAGQQGLNFCNDADTNVQALKSLAVNGTTDGSTSLIGGLTTDMVALLPERVNLADGSLNACDCSATGCDITNGGLPPDFIVAYIPEGYSIRPLFFGFAVDPILFRPHVRVPYGGA